MTDILAKATVEFMQPLEAMECRLANLSPKDSISPWQVGKLEHVSDDLQTSFEVIFKDAPNFLFRNISIDVSKRKYFTEEIFTKEGFSRKKIVAIDDAILMREFLRGTLITIDTLSNDGFVFIVHHRFLKDVHLDRNETLLITFTVKRNESEEPKVSTIREVVPVYLSQFDEFKGYVDAKLAYLEGSISGLIRKVADMEGKKDD